MSRRGEINEQWIGIAVGGFLIVFILWIVGCSAPAPGAGRPRLVLVVYTTPGCYQCEADKPTIAAIRGVEVREIVVQDARQAAQLGLTGFPTYMLFDGKRLLWRGHNATEALTITQRLR